ncbi:hypothetical protein HDU92_008485, partial [Lobulomyces angularis]
MKFALLKCDTPPPPLLPLHGDYTQIFNNLFENVLTHQKHLLKLNDSNIQCTSFDVINGEYPSNPEQFDLIVLTGSKFSSYQNEPWILNLKKFCKLVIEKNLSKLLGVCFGHQVIAEAFGGKVEPNLAGWEVGWTDIKLNDFGISNFGKENMKINSMHKDHVTVTPQNFEIFSYTDICPNQGMIGYNNRVVTIQGHPEFTPEFVTALVKIRTGIIFDETFANKVLENSSKDLD